MSQTKYKNSMHLITSRYYNCESSAIFFQIVQTKHKNLVKLIKNIALPNTVLLVVLKIIETKYKNIMLVTLTEIQLYYVFHFFRK